MKKIVLCFFLTVFLFSCKKEQQSFCVDAVVKWGGAPEADGLGWYLVQDDTIDSLTHISYIPQNLPDAFKVDNLAVNACMYQTSEKFYCMCAQPVVKFHITSIQRR